MQFQLSVATQKTLFLLLTLHKYHHKLYCHFCTSIKLPRNVLCYLFCEQRLNDLYLQTTQSWPLPSTYVAQSHTGHRNPAETVVLSPHMAIALFMAVTAFTPSYIFTWYKLWELWVGLSFNKFLRKCPQVLNHHGSILGEIFCSAECVSYISKSPMHLFPLVLLYNITSP